MTDFQARVERARLRARLSQAQVSQTFQITQGHYSKVIKGKVTLTDKLRHKMEAWLVKQEDPVKGIPTAQRLQELAASIQIECMEIMHLAGLINRSD
jgi:transcriptional regulator with XRE-family HTH domain